MNAKALLYLVILVLIAGRGPLQGQSERSATPTFRLAETRVRDAFIFPDETSGTLMSVLHRPNSRRAERALLFELDHTGDTVRLLGRR